MIVFGIRRKSDGLYLKSVDSIPVQWGQPISAKQWKSAGDAGWVLSELRGVKDAAGEPLYEYEVVPMESLLGQPKQDR